MNDIKPLSLKHNFYWTLTGNLTYAGSQWAILIVLAKIGSPEMVGQFSLGLAVTAPIFMLTSLQLRGIQATDASLEFPFHDYFMIRITSSCLALIVIAFIIKIIGYKFEVALIIMLIGIAKAIESISDILFGLMQLHEQMDKIAKSMICKGLLSVVVLTGAMYATGSLAVGVGFLVVAWFLILVGYDLPSMAKLLHTPLVAFIMQLKASLVRIISGRTTLIELVTIALPMGLVMMLVSLNTNIPRYFIERYLGERDLGIYSAISYLLIAGTTIVGALGQSATPRLAKLFAAREYYGFRQLVLKLIAIGCLLGCFGVMASVFFGRYILSLVYRPEYASHTGLFALVMVAAGIAYVSSFLGYSITAARQFKVQLPLFAIVTCFTFTACYMLIGTQKLVGAGIALVISGGVQLLGSCFIIWRIIRKLQPVKGLDNV
jgi:O-antigen/teichoic acid export membrane protein